ncbi:MAG: chemotaxis protein CheW [Candidatus Hydrogenedentota bacterium]
MTTASHPAREGKYLTFALGGEEYGLEIMKVLEIVGLLPITPVPGTPLFIRGLINLRGNVIPVVDLRRKFGMPAAEDHPHHCIIVVEAGRAQMGLLVDRVSEVLYLKESSIGEAPSWGSSVETRFVSGIGKVENGIRILLDIENVLSAEETALLEEWSSDPERKNEP